ncbi:hypothetical protein NHX12_005201 [Muraenolepis orangiensis]|uniref:Tumor necrosis factor receptor type 1-associated DEATH domain protein n=1 Tax=Muraenolepis orangiensis TaxID=630683 RepID=A0A9Q0DSQ8_9TELE|nr:hypothetical protein NHX12_005201 [Muraenolepis orangiensis]
MAETWCVNGAWTGCAVLFLESMCPPVDLLSLYKDPQKKFTIFKVIKLTLTGKLFTPAMIQHAHGSTATRPRVCPLSPDSAGGLGGYEILKLHDANPQLGVEVKFVDMDACHRFLKSYESGAMGQSFSQHAGRLLSVSPEFKVETRLKAGTHTLDLCLDSLEDCLQHIHLSQSARLRDDEMEDLEQQLQNQALGQTPRPPPLPQQEQPLSKDSFDFQRGVFDDRILTAADIHSFSNGVGRQWKHVGRALAKSCRALSGPAIDNLAYEYEREGLYEQAYQMLSRFTQAEGRAAKLGRLVRALEDCKLNSLAENILGIA